MTTRALLPTGVLLLALLGLGGCGSVAAPGPTKDTDPGLSVQQSCQRIGAAFAAGTTSPEQLRTFAAAVDKIVGAASDEARAKLKALPEHARALADAPDSEAGLTTFQADVTTLQRTCTKQGSPFAY